MVEGFVGQFVEPTRGDIVINLLVPPLVEILLKPGSDSTRVLKRHFAQSIFNFCDCAHAHSIMPPDEAGKAGRLLSRHCQCSSSDGGEKWGFLPIGQAVGDNSG